MFENISDVPKEIAEFYTTHVANEQQFDPESGKPLLKDEPYQYPDENGEMQAGTRKVPVFLPVTHVVEIGRGRQKPWPEVERISALGKPRDVVETFIAEAVERDRWLYHDEYLVWMEKCAAIDVQIAALERARNVDGHYQADDPDTLLDEAWQGGVSPEQLAASRPEPPIRSVRDGREYLVALAKRERDDGEYLPITVDGLTFDTDLKSYERIKGTVDSWDILVNDAAFTEAGLVECGRMYWTLADNSNVLVDKATLERVLAAVRGRAGLLHARYQAAKA